MRKLFLAIAFVLLAQTAQAQETGPCPTGNTPVVNSNGRICITVTATYDATETNALGTMPIVQSLNVMLFGPSVANTATDAPTQQVNIGKPARNAAGAVWVTVPAITQIPVGQEYTLRVTSVGNPATAGGTAQVSARSPESNPFTRLAAPTAPPAPSAVTVPAS